MLFNSWVFAAFFAIFFPVYLLVRRRVGLRNAWILVASYVFYGWWNPRFVTLLAILAAVDYLAAKGVAGQPVRHADRVKGALFTMAVTAGCALFSGPDGAWLLRVVGICVVALLLAMWLADLAPEHKRRRLWLYLSIFANLGVLAYFKYANFFIESAQSALAALGMPSDPVLLHVILPIGLSFHVFQGVGRTIDCYRGTVKPEGSLTSVAAYLAFFPQLVAGPIERASRLIPQFERVLPLDAAMFRSGALLFLWGLYMKLVVADNVAPIANASFGQAATADGGTAIAGILAFTVQIYCDFAGYSNMARGLARCLGFELMENFNLPYFSRTPSEFWRRWHISLSTWLRDYLYIGLGGNRGSEARTWRNLLLTMLLGGLWHGAAWTFVVWGAFHGLILVVYRALRIDALLERIPMRSPSGTLLHVGAWAVMMVLVMIGWVYFRAESFTQAAQMLLAPFNGLEWQTGQIAAVLWIFLPLALVECVQRIRGVHEVLNAGPFFWRYTATIVVLMAILLISAPPGQDFIYFDF
jgi:D-alanyl-lipoteichoic acid acyltransferase DltB (MBOAT superfamily)